MRADITFLKERFFHFNAEIFYGQLPTPDFNISNARSFVGQFRHERIPRAFGASSEKRCLTLSNRYDLPEKVLEDIIIHEMIHYHIHFRKLRDSSSHGPIFRRLMNEINCRFGRNITVSHRCTPQELDSDDAKTHSIVCLCRMKDGRTLVCRVAQSRIFEVHRALEAWNEVVSQEWYWVFGSYFNRYRKVQTPKLFSIDHEGIDKTKAGTRLEFAVDPTGRNVLRPQRDNL